MGSSQSRPVRSGRSWSFAGAEARRQQSNRDSIDSYYEQRRYLSTHRSPYSGDSSITTSPTTPKITFMDSDRLGDGNALSRNGSLLDKLSLAPLTLDGKGSASRSNSSLGGRAKRAATLRDFKSPSFRSSSSSSGGSGNGNGQRRIGRSRANTAATRLRQLLGRISRQPHITTDDGELIRVDNLPFHLVLSNSDLDQEIDRQHIDHYMLRLGLSGNRFAPATSPSCVLDIGTGSGIWMLEMAVEYPECEFVGIDIADYPHRATSDNCDFRRMNILDGLRFPDDRFDLVFQRNVANSIPVAQWPSHVSECARVCQPGGWVEMIDTSGMLMGRDGMEATTPYASLYNRAVRGLLHRSDIDPTICNRLSEMFRMAGNLSDVHQRVYRIPVGYGALNRSSFSSARNSSNGSSNGLSSSRSSTSGSSGALASGRTSFATVPGSPRLLPGNAPPQLALSARMAKEVVAGYLSRCIPYAVKADIISEKEALTLLGENYAMKSSTKLFIWNLSFATVASNAIYKQISITTSKTRTRRHVVWIVSMFREKDTN
ncbi:hypothetical protein BDF22DRAFT_351339 [Syncephalis plumigaleata]|nr:hypothetical protein BDF22DRAFT_351339 [Syncephalis plumigaleata]